MSSVEEWAVVVRADVGDTSAEWVTSVLCRGDGEVESRTRPRRFMRETVWLSWALSEGFVMWRESRLACCVCCRGGRGAAEGGEYVVLVEGEVGVPAIEVFPLG